jgi:hypothetical protein
MGCTQHSVEREIDKLERVLALTLDAQAIAVLEQKICELKSALRLLRRGLASRESPI